MITLTIQIEGSKYKGVFRLSPGFDATTATDQECELFEGLLERLAPGIDFDESLEDQMDYLADALCGAHDPNSEEDFSGPEKELSA